MKTERITVTKRFAALWELGPGNLKLTSLGEI